MVQSIVLGVLPIVVSRLLERGRLIQLKEIVNNRAKRAEEIYSTTYGTVVLEYLYCTLSYGVLRECRNTVHICWTKFEMHICACLCLYDRRQKRQDF